MATPTVPLLLLPTPPTRPILEAFISRHEHLLTLERAAEEEQTRLLDSNCSPKLLEQRGLALGGLGVSSLTVGLGGKSLVELYRPSAYHTDPGLPPHTFRNGDPVRIEAHITTSTTKTKAKKKDDEEVDAVEGIVYRVSAEKVVVAVEEGKDVDLPERLRLIKLANTVTFDRMDRTLVRLKKIVLPEPDTKTTEPANINLVEVLLGLQSPTWLKDVPLTIKQLAARDAAKSSGPVGVSVDIPPGETKWYGDALNDSQKEAIEFCLKAEHVACIHGPPGTGKTHTLIELIFQLLSRPANRATGLPPRILVTTPSNLALDNLLLRLHTLSKQPPYSALLPPGSILRLGHPTRVHKDLIRETLDYKAANGDDGELVRDVSREIEGNMADLAKKKGEKGAIKGKDRGRRWEEVRVLRKEYRQREAKVVVNVVKQARVVLATCHSAGSRQLNNVNFDICIVDEATQAVEAVCWVPILKSRKLILAGDPKQLPPTIMSKADRLKRVKGLTSPKINGNATKSTAERDGHAQPSDDTVDKAQEPDTGGEESEDSSDLEDKMMKTTVSAKTAHTELKPPRTLATTLFDRLEKMVGPGIKRVLQIQYRMNEVIAAFPSSALYDSALISSPLVAKRTLLDLPTIVDPSSEDAKDTLQPTAIFFDTAGCEFYERSEGELSDSGGKAQRGIGEGSKSNENEAEAVAKWARRLVSHGVPAEEIAVVTPYQAQVSLISTVLHPEFPGMTIGSVDGLQGQEREAIILTLVRSNETGEVGFLSEYRRLNVAMTRAKRQLCVVGDSSTISKGSKYLKSWMDWLETNADVRWAGDQT